LKEEEEEKEELRMLFMFVWRKGHILHKYCFLYTSFWRIRGR